MKKVKFFAAILAVLFVVGSAFTSKKVDDITFGLLSRVDQGSGVFRYTVTTASGFCDNTQSNYACQVTINPSASGVSTVTANQVYDITEATYLPATIDSGKQWVLF